MKRNIIIVIIVGILTGYLFGHLIYKDYKGLEYLSDDGNIYYIQYGVYTSNEAALSNVSQLDNYVIYETDEKYYVYLGITSSYNTALKIQELYEEKDIHTYIRSDYVNNSETLNVLKEYDLKLDSVENEDDINMVLKEIFENNKLNF